MMEVIEILAVVILLTFILAMVAFLVILWDGMRAKNDLDKLYQFPLINSAIGIRLAVRLGRSGDKPKRKINISVEWVGVE